MFGIVSSDIKGSFGENAYCGAILKKMIGDKTEITEAFYSGSKDDYDDVQKSGANCDNMDYLWYVLDGRGPKYENEIAVTTLVSRQLTSQLVMGRTFLQWEKQNI